MPVRCVQTALLAEVLEGDIPSLESYARLLEVSVNAADPGAVLVEVYFWRTAAKDGKKSLEHVLSIGDRSPRQFTPRLQQDPERGHPTTRDWMHAPAAGCSLLLHRRLGLNPLNRQGFYPFLDTRQRKPNLPVKRRETEVEGT